MAATLQIVCHPIALKDAGIIANRRVLWEIGLDERSSGDGRTRVGLNTETLDHIAYNVGRVHAVHYGRRLVAGKALDLSTYTAENVNTDQT